MEFSVQTSLFSYIIARLGGILEKSNDPSDTGRYIILKTHNNKLSATIFRDDILANIVIDSTLLPSKSMLKIVSDGTYAVNGNNLTELICNVPTDGTIDAKFEDSLLSLDKREEDKDDTSLSGVGSLVFGTPGLTGKQEKTWLQCVNIPTPKQLEVKNNSGIKVETDGFVKLIDKVGVSAGKSTNNIEHSHMLLSTSKNQLNITTFNGLSLAWGIVSTDGHGNVGGLAPHGICSIISKALVPEGEISIYEPESGPKGMVIHQELPYAGSYIGRSIYRTFSISDSFSNFKQMIKNLDFRYKCKVKTQHLANITKRLSVFEKLKTKLVFDPKENCIFFSKEEAGAKIEKYILPMVSSEGEKLEITVSSKFLKDGVSQCESDELEIKFSGKRTLVLMNVADNVKFFFQPFGKGE